MAHHIQNVDEMLVRVVAAPGTKSDISVSVDGDVTVLNAGPNSFDYKFDFEGNPGLGEGGVRVSTGAGADQLSFSGSSSDAASTEASQVVVETGDGDDRIQASRSDNAMTLNGGAGSDFIRGGSGNDVIYGDGVNGNDFHTIEAVFGGNKNNPTNSSSEVTVTGFRAGESLEDASADKIGGHNKGIGVKAAQADRPSIKQETGYDPVIQQSEGVVFTLDKDAAFASFDLSYFFSKKSGADIWHNETGKWSVYDNGHLVKTGTFTADQANGKYVLEIPEIAGGNRYFDKVVLEGLPYEMVQKGDKAFDRTYNHGEDFDSSDFLVKKATFETVGHDRLHGGAGDDQIFGGYGHDRISGGEGFDILDGGKGSDWLIYNDEPDTGELFTLEDEGLDDAALHEYDGVRVSLHEDYKDLNAGGAEKDTYSNFEHLQGSNRADMLMGDDKNNVIQGLNGQDTLVGLGGRDNLQGGNGDDVLYGDSITGEGGSHDRLYGQNGNDKMFAGGGNDWLVGGHGQDFYDGGAGYDWAQVIGSEQVVIDLAKDTIFNDGYGFEETIVNVEHLHTGGHDDILYGDEKNNRIDAGYGQNIVDGREGIDTIDYHYHANSNITVNLEEGYGRTTYRGKDHVDTLSNFENVFGGKKDDILIGDSGANRLDGWYGDDILYGDAPSKTDDDDDNDDDNDDDDNVLRP